MRDCFARGQILTILTKWWSIDDGTETRSSRVAQERCSARRRQRDRDNDSIARCACAEGVQGNDAVPGQAERREAVQQLRAIHSRQWLPDRRGHGEPSRLLHRVAEEAVNRN